MKRKILDTLIAWKESPDRKPLILDGARQVGKTWSIKEFGKRAYAAFAYVNLEIDASVADFFSSDIDPGRLLRFLETYTNQRIHPGKTLVILDEIQSCERALSSLKYFNEQAPDYHIAAAGSLFVEVLERTQSPLARLDFIKNDKRFSRMDALIRVRLQEA